MSIRWDTSQQPQYNRVDQAEQTDLEFLQSLGKDAGLSMKITKNQIVFFDEEEYEKRPPAFSIYRRTPVESNILSYSFQTKITDTAVKSTVAFVNPETGRVTKTTFTDPNPDSKYPAEIVDHSALRYEQNVAVAASGGGKGSAPPTEKGKVAYEPYPDWLLDKESENVATKKDGTKEAKGAGAKKVAERKAKKNLREANKERQTATFDMMGDPLRAAGQTCMVEGFGYYDGKYFLEKLSHELGGGGYKLNLNVRKCLEGY
jgi:hypothetical protein